jgi:hypothetical protein
MEDEEDVFSPSPSPLTFRFNFDVVVPDGEVDVDCEEVTGMGLEGDNFPDDPPKLNPSRDAEADRFLYADSSSDAESQASSSPKVHSELVFAT